MRAEPGTDLKRAGGGVRHYPPNRLPPLLALLQTVYLPPKQPSACHTAWHAGS